MVPKGKDRLFSLLPPRSAEHKRYGLHQQVTNKGKVKDREEAESLKSSHVMLGLLAAPCRCSIVAEFSEYGGELGPKAAANCDEDL